MRPWILFPLAAALLVGCEQHRITAGVRIDSDPAAPDKIQASFNDLSLKQAVQVEGEASRVENGFLVVQLRVRNTTSRNLPCEWRATFQDKDGMDIPLTANPWTPAILNSNVTETLSKTAPSSGAERAVFYLREASPLRK